MRKISCRLLYAAVVMLCFAICPSSALAVTSPDEFYDKYIGESVDVDDYPASQPYQCYDLWAQFVMDEYGTTTPIIIGPTGYPRDIWNNFDGLGLGAYFTKVTGSPQDGDWVIYDCPAFSHVGMFRSDNGDGTIMILHQNYHGQREVTQDRFTDSYILGYIRPNIYIDGTREVELNPTISINKKEISPGETVTFNFTAANASRFVIRIYQDDTRIEKKDCGSKTSYTRSFSDPGEYSAYVTAYNADQSEKSRRIDFTVVPEPEAPGVEEPEPSDPNHEAVSDGTGNDGLPETKPITVTVNGAPVIFDQLPIICQGRAMVPMRAIFQALGAEVDWEVGQQKVTATKDETTIIVKIGETQATVNGGEKTLDVPAQIINNRTLVPVRFISESLGADVDWVIKSQTVMISMN